MNTYVVYSHHYGGKEGDTHRQVDRVQAASIRAWQKDPELAIVFGDDDGNITGVVRDFDAVYLESAVLEPYPTKEASWDGDTNTNPGGNPIA